MFKLVVTFYDKEEKKTYLIGSALLEHKQEWVNVMHEFSLKGLTLYKSPYKVEFIDNEGLPYMSCYVSEQFVMNTLLRGADPETVVDSSKERPYTLTLENLDKEVF